MAAQRRDSINPGPIDPSVLTEQDRHRSTSIWRGEKDMIIRPRKSYEFCSALVYADHRVVPYIRMAGFTGTSHNFLGIQLDWGLITALVERWRPETHTFHFPVGEATITLQDVSVLFGLPINGLPVITTRTHVNIDVAYIHNLLGFIPNDNERSGSKLALVAITRHIAEELPDEATVNMLEQRARCLLLLVIGGCLLADKTTKYVSLDYLPLLADLNHCGQYSWGSAVLAFLYRQLCKATCPETNTISGAIALLQIWAWERMPYIAPDIDMSNTDWYNQPLARRWSTQTLRHKNTPGHVIGFYRDQFDHMHSSQFIWEPYTLDVIQLLPNYCIDHQDLWRARCPMLCFHIVEWHYPDRVLRQFGMRQTIPDNCGYDNYLHNVDARGSARGDWLSFHANYVNLWNNRMDSIITRERDTEGLAAYMRWFTRITRRLMQPIPIPVLIDAFQPTGTLVDTWRTAWHRVQELLVAAQQESNNYQRQQILLNELRLITNYALHVEFQPDTSMNDMYVPHVNPTPTHASTPHPYMSNSSSHMPYSTSHSPYSQPYPSGGPSYQMDASYSYAVPFEQLFTPSPMPRPVDAYEYHNVYPMETNSEAFQHAYPQSRDATQGDFTQATEPIPLPPRRNPARRRQGPLCGTGHRLGPDGQH